jgi:hypothetical protein
VGNAVNVSSKTDQWIALNVLVVSLLPAMSLWEFAENGFIDFDAVVTRRGADYSVWVLYLIGWLVSLYMLLILYIPRLQYAYYGYVFRFENDGIVVRGKFLSKDSICTWEIDSPKALLHTNEGTVKLHIEWVEGGLEALQEFLD